MDKVFRLQHKLPRLLAIAALFGAVVVAPCRVRAQLEQIAERMAGMSTAEKVGQLFIVAFWGRNPSPQSRAGKLIQQYKIGGVVLIGSNSNLVNQDMAEAGRY